ncbi:MAG: hypothetical protein JXX28_01195 [Deltaproteobacteria bacterium]|nr:hypothetical protein [Deltaproteobacteria bacterium]
MLARVLKRRTSLEQQDAEVFLETEFRTREGRFDLALSVYQIDRGEELQAACEHVLSFISPKRGVALLNAQGVAGPSLRISPGSTLFRFTRTQHRELVFEDEDAPRTFTQTLVPMLQQRGTRFSGGDLLKYAHARLDARDTEREEAMAEAPRRKDWRPERP